MKFPQVHTLRQIAAILDCDYVGPEDFPVSGMNEIHVVEPGDIVFVDHPKYYDKALNSAATVVLINKQVECPEDKALLISDDPFRDFNKLTGHFRPFERAGASVSPTAAIGENTIIQPNVFIGNHVIIGDNCVIHPNVTIYDNTVIGNNVTIHAGTVLGADAFYYKKRPEGFDKLLSGGNVIIEDFVDLGVSIAALGQQPVELLQIGEAPQIARRLLIAKAAVEIATDRDMVDASGELANMIDVID